MHNSSLVAIAQYFLTNPHICPIWQSKKFNTDAVNDYPPIRFEIRFERKFPIVGLYFLTLPPYRNPAKSVPRGKAIWNANGGFVSVLLTHLLLLLLYGKTVLYVLFHVFCMCDVRHDLRLDSKDLQTFIGSKHVNSASHALCSIIKPW